MDRVKTIVVRLSKEEKEIFAIMAQKKGLPISQYIRSLILDKYWEIKGIKNADRN